MPGVRRRVPAKREARRPKGEFSLKRQLGAVRGTFFSVGLYEGKGGRVLKNYVNKMMSASA